MVLNFDRNLSKFFINRNGQNICYLGHINLRNLMNSHYLVLYLIVKCEINRFLIYILIVQNSYYRNQLYLSLVTIRLFKATHTYFGRMNYTFDT